MSFLSRLIEGFKAFWCGEVDDDDDPIFVHMPNNPEMITGILSIPDELDEGIVSIIREQWDDHYMRPIQMKHPFFKAQEAPDEQWD